MLLTAILSVAFAVFFSKVTLVLVIGALVYVWYLSVMDSLLGAIAGTILWLPQIVVMTALLIKS